VGPSSLDAAYVTEGDLRDNVHFAAGVSLCRAAGCIVTDLDGRPVDTGGSPATRAGLIAAAAEATHAAMLALMHE
jgi:myo-inositol-1(or 4)-monophosphatase